MKIDRVIQLCKAKEGTEFKTRISTKDFVVVPEENGFFTVKTNPGKTIGQGNNIGVEVGEFKMHNETMLDGLGLELERNNLLEFMEDIEIKHKMIENKNIIISFHNALTEFGCKRITNTFKGEKGVRREKQSLIGAKGYKNNNYSIKLYSKHEEQGLKGYDKDKIRIEVVLDSRAIDKLKLSKELKEKPVIDFLIEILDIWEKVLGRKNRYSIPTFELIAEIRNKITKVIDVNL